MKEATFTVYVTRIVLNFIARHGVNVGELCATSGFNSDLLQMPDERIPSSIHLAVWQEAVKQTGNENLALHIGEASNLGDMGIVGYLLINCQTLGEALTKLSRYTSLFCQSAQMKFSVSDGIVFYDYTVTDDVKNYLLEEPHYTIEWTFASFLTAAAALTGQTLRLSAAWFHYASPANTSEYDRIFQTELKFSMPVSRLIFDASCLSWPILSSNSNLLPLFESQAETMLNEMNRGDRYSQKVVQAIIQQLTGDLPTIDAIAHDLAISVRQLQRELQTEGITFQKLLDATRKELALQQLKDPTIPIHAIAFLLGFSEPSAFNRAFKRWTGKTPRNYRLIGKE